MVALYHGKGPLQSHILDDIIISDKDELNDIKINFANPVRAIFINYEDHGYALIRYDLHTINFITHSLFEVQTMLERANVWQMMWFAVMSCKVSPTRYFEFFVSQLPHETE